MTAQEDADARAALRDLMARENELGLPGVAERRRAFSAARADPSPWDFEEARRLTAVYFLEQDRLARLGVSLSQRAMASGPRDWSSAVLRAVDLLRVDGVLQRRADARSRREFIPF